MSKWTRYKRYFATRDWLSSKSELLTYPDLFRRFLPINSASRSAPALSFLSITLLFHTLLHPPPTHQHQLTKHGEPFSSFFDLVDPELTFFLPHFPSLLPFTLLHYLSSALMPTPTLFVDAPFPPLPSVFRRRLQTHRTRRKD